MSREEQAIVATAAAGDRHDARGRRTPRQLRVQRGARPTQLPAVAPVVVEALPEGRVAGCGLRAHEASTGAGAAPRVAKSGFAPQAESMRTDGSVTVTAFGPP